MHNLCKWGAALTACLLAFSGLANADTYRDVATLQCQGNQAIIRVGGIWNDDLVEYRSLPNSLPQDWAPPADTPLNECELENGEHIEMKFGSKQSFHYGMGGLAPSGFISLWAANKKLLSKHIVISGYADQAARNVSAIVYEPSALTICSTAQPRSTNDPDTDVCSQHEVDTSTLPIDNLHALQTDVDIGAISVAATYSKSFCEQFITAMSDIPVHQRHATIASTQHAAIDYHHLIDGATSPSDDALTVRHKKNSALELNRALYDFDNDGENDTVIHVSGDNHYFDGSMIWFKMGNHPNAAESMSKTEFPEGSESWAIANGFTKVSGQDTPYERDRYTTLTPFRLDGVTYVFAQPLLRRKNPTAILYRPQPSEELDRVCTFQIAREAF